MEIDINYAESNLLELIKKLTDNQVSSIIICKNGIPIVEMRASTKKQKRVGIAKNHIKSISLNDLNSFDLTDILH